MNLEPNLVLSDFPTDDESFSFDASEVPLGDRRALEGTPDDEEGGLMFRSLLERPDVLWDVWRATTARRHGDTSRTSA